MIQATQHPKAPNRLTLGRLGSAALALGGLAGSLALMGTAGASSSMTVSTTKNASFGTILVVSGRTVYTVKPSKTACTGACLQVWPEVLLPKGVKHAKAGSGVSASKLGTVKRSGGALQVTYGGKALYWFSGDTSSGQATGNVTDAWGKWSSVATKGVHASSGSGSGSGGSSSGTGGASF
jgi:predicted lipoprotein with Yx(FWY)xxD motif